MRLRETEELTVMFYARDDADDFGAMFADFITKVGWRRDGGYSANTWCVPETTVLEFWLSNPPTARAWIDERRVTTWWDFAGLAA